MPVGATSDLYFDAVGAHAPGYAAAPRVSPDEAATDSELGGQRYFTFRRVEDLRAVMADRGDEDKQVVVTEFGWTTDAREDSPYHWFAVSDGERANHIRDAYDYAQASWTGWLGPMILFSAADPAWTQDDEAWWWSVTDASGHVKPSLRAEFAGD